MRNAFRVSLVAVLLALALPAGAAEIATTDPDDVAGKLDLRELSFEAERNGAGFFTVKTHDAFGCNYLKKGKPNRLKLLFDDGRDGDVDLVGRFECMDGTLLMFLHGKESGNNYEPLKAKRPTRKVAKVAFQLDIAEFESDTMGVKVRSVDGTAEGCTDDPCKDGIPAKGSVKAY